MHDYVVRTKRSEGMPDRDRTHSQWILSGCLAAQHALPRTIKGARRQWSVERRAARETTPRPFHARALFAYSAHIGMRVNVWVSTCVMPSMPSSFAMKASSGANPH